MENAGDGQSPWGLLLEKDLMSMFIVLANIAYGLQDQCARQCGLDGDAEDWFPTSTITYWALTGALSFCGDVNKDKLMEVLSQPMASFLADPCN